MNNSKGDTMIRLIVIAVLVFIIIKGASMNAFESVVGGVISEASNNISASVK
jgi:hypothetical protein